MRVYEFSKESGVSSKELLARLRKAGFKISSHMSVLPGDAVIFLKKELSKVISMQEQKVQVKSTAPAPARQSVQKKEPRDAKAQVKVDKKPITLAPCLVSDLAEWLGVSVNELILTMLKSGIVAPKNKVLPEDIVETIARHYDTEVIRPAGGSMSRLQELAISDSRGQERPPVVVVVGHVDHGKTTLLDFMRKSRIASREQGGITQHLGAYHVTTNHGGVIFLDTPGHEAFVKMRARGVNVADIAVLVVAADDGVMPQTIESIKAAKEMGVPIVVAINKIDKVDAQRLEVVKRQLSQYDLLPEDWGGQTVVVPISAKMGSGVDSLLDLLVLQAQLMELKADPNAPVKGYVLESKMQKGRGVVGTLLCQQGTVHVGDFFVCGSIVGKVSSLVNSDGKPVKQAGPSIPVQVSGFQGLPEAGSSFIVVSQKEYKKARAGSFKPEVMLRPKNLLLRDRSINMLIKADTHSSKEALVDSIHKLRKKVDIDLVVISAGVGDVSEADIDLAAATGSIILGFHVKTNANATATAKKLKVQIEHYGVIYKLLEAVQSYAEKEREVKMVQSKVGEAIVRKVFDIKGIGVIAGCYVQDGRFVRDGFVTVWRGRKKIGEGKMTSLQRANKNVKEVHTGYECAFGVKDLTDYNVDDRVECYIEVPEGEGSKKAR